MVEIERKFLIKDRNWSPTGNVTKIRQGYLTVDPERVVRVRITDENAYLTIKGKTDGIARTELEYEIPKNEAELLLEMCLDFPIVKTRTKMQVDGMLWEVDVFEGENKGLILAEIELSHKNQKIDLPDWIGEEVSLDNRYFNSWLSKNPFSRW